MVLRRTQHKHSGGGRASLTLTVEGAVPEDIVRLTGPIWDHISEPMYTHSQLQFDGPFIRTFSMESRSDPSLMAGVHIREILDRVEAVSAAVRNCARHGALVTLHYRSFGDVFCDAVELSVNDLLRIAKLSARIAWYSSSLEHWDETYDRLNGEFGVNDRSRVCDEKDR